jgi:hypothetical protein
METGLWAHPAYPSAAIDGEIGATVRRLSRQTVQFRYVLIGRIDELVLPPTTQPLRADNLWQTTCFEAFIGPESNTSYREFNFSPSSQWAAYDFLTYRSGMVQAGLPAPPEIAVNRRSDRLAVTVTLSLDLPEEPYRLGLSAVIEEQGGRKSYWAVSHQDDSPDFHRRDCFTLRLPPAA